MELLINIVAHDNCPILNLFIDWNPIYTDEGYSGGYLEDNKDHLYQPVEDEENPVPSLWASLVEKAKKV